MWNFHTAVAIGNSFWKCTYKDISILSYKQNNIFGSETGFPLILIKKLELEFVKNITGAKKTDLKNRICRILISIIL